MLRLRTWGGARPGAGRKPSGPCAGVSHRRRPSLARRFPLHVTVRMRPHVWNLRSRRCFTRLRSALWAGADRFGFRLVHYAVQRNHVHLLVEAADRRALWRGMQGLGVRMAKALNRVMDERRGSVLADRYHARVLRTPTEMARVRHDLANDAQKHDGWRGADPYASASSVAAPRTWLLRRQC